jgi:hypothetical protein
MTNKEKLIIIEQMIEEAREEKDFDLSMKLKSVRYRLKYKMIKSKIVDGDMFDGKRLF